MRTLIAGALAATLAGCSCYMTPQSGLQACAGADGFACLGKNSGGPPWTAEKASSSGASAPPEKPARRKTMMKRLSARTSDKTPDAGKTDKPVANVEPKVEPAAVMQAPQDIDPVADRARIAVAVKLEDPKSATFSDMKRSMRKNLLGQSLDTICGHVKSKKASGEDIGDRPFLYVVKDDVAFVADDSPNSPASTAYRDICN